MQCRECGVEIKDGLYCATHAGKPDKANYMGNSPTVLAPPPMSIGYQCESMGSPVSMPPRKSSRLMWVSLAIVAALILVAFFFFGR